MGSLVALPPQSHAVDMASSSSAPSAATTHRLPELGDTDYAAEVLRLDERQQEVDIDVQLAQKAAELGISASRPSTAQEPVTSTAESAITATSNHVRTASTGSQNSTSTALTAQSSIVRVGSNGTADVKGNTVTRTRSKSLNFSQYDKYLAQVDPNLNQPKFLSSPPPGREPAPSLFSVSTRKSYTTIKNGIKTRISSRWRKTRPGTANGATAL